MPNLQLAAGNPVKAIELVARVTSGELARNDGVLFSLPVLTQRDSCPSPSRRISSIARPIAKGTPHVTSGWRQGHATPALPPVDAASSYSSDRGGGCSPVARADDYSTTRAAFRACFFFGKRAASEQAESGEYRRSDHTLIHARRVPGARTPERLDKGASFAGNATRPGS